MAKPAGKLLNAAGVAFYEQPLSERMRTLMRLEFLYQQLLYNSDDASDWASRASITTVLDVLAILSRGDLRSEIHKELEHQLNILQRFQSQPGVDDVRQQGPALGSDHAVVPALETQDETG